MKKLLVLALSLLLLSPSFCLAAGKTLHICGKIKQTINYSNPKKNIKYRYVIIEELETFSEEFAAYDRQLPYGLYMFKIAPGVKAAGDCFDIDMNKQTVISSTEAG